MEFCETCRKAAILGIEIPTASISSTEFFCDFVIKCTSLEIIIRNIPGHMLSHWCLSAELRLCGDTITTVLAGNAVIEIVSAADSSGYRCSFCTGEQRRVGTNGNLLSFGELTAIGVDRISVGIKYRISDFAGFFRIF